MIYKMNFKVIWLFLAMVLALVGCSSDSSDGRSNTVVSGVAAAGSVIKGVVYLKDSSSPTKELVTTIADDGSYLFPVSGMTKPFLLKTVGISNGINYTLYSVATDSGITNINPLSNLITSIAARDIGDPGAIYDNPQVAAMQTIGSNIAPTVAGAQKTLDSWLDEYNTSVVAAMNAQYKADHNGIDGMFDAVKITIGNGTVSIYNINTGKIIIQTTTLSAVAAGTVAGTVDTNAINEPVVPGVSVPLKDALISGSLCNAFIEDAEYDKYNKLFLFDSSNSNYDFMAGNKNYRVIDDPWTGRKYYSIAEKYLSPYVVIGQKLPAELNLTGRYAAGIYAQYCYGLSSDSKDIVLNTSFYDNASKKWAEGSQVPQALKDLFADDVSDNGYSLTANGWVKSDAIVGTGLSGFSFDSDGALISIDPNDGKLLTKISLTAKDVSGKALTAYDLFGLENALFLISGIHPAGAVQYDLVEELFTDDYWLINELPYSGFDELKKSSHVSMHSGDFNAGFEARLHETSCDIYQTIANGFDVNTKIATVPYSVKTVSGVEILEIDYGADIRNNYGTGNPIFSMVNGKLYEGVHDVAGYHYTHVNSSRNPVDTQYLLETFMLADIHKNTAKTLAKKSAKTVAKEAPQKKSVKRKFIF